MRQARAGFISTVDTILALEALVRYSYNNNIRDLTNMQVLTSHDQTGQQFVAEGDSGFAGLQYHPKPSHQPGRHQVRQLCDLVSAMYRRPGLHSTEHFCAAGPGYCQSPTCGATLTWRPGAAARPSSSWTSPTGWTTNTTGNTLRREVEASCLLLSSKTGTYHPSPASSSRSRSSTAGATSPRSRPGPATAGPVHRYRIAM